MKKRSVSYKVKLYTSKGNGLLLNFIFRCQVAHYYSIYPWLGSYPVGYFRKIKRGRLTISCFVYFMQSHLALYAS